MFFDKRRKDINVLDLCDSSNDDGDNDKSIVEISSNSSQDAKKSTTTTPQTKEPNTKTPRKKKSKINRKDDDKDISTQQQSSPGKITSHFSIGTTTKTNLSSRIIRGRKSSRSRSDASSLNTPPKASARQHIASSVLEQTNSLQQHSSSSSSIWPKTQVRGRPSPNQLSSTALAQSSLAQKCDPQQKPTPSQRFRNKKNNNNTLSNNATSFGLSGTLNDKFYPLQAMLSSSNSSTSIQPALSASKPPADKKTNEFSSTSSSSTPRKKPPPTITLPNPNCSISSTSSDNHIFKPPKKKDTTKATSNHEKRPCNSEVSSASDDFYNLNKNKSSLININSKLKKSTKKNKKDKKKVKEKKRKKSNSSESTLTEDEPVKKKKKINSDCAPVAKGSKEKLTTSAAKAKEDTSSTAKAKKKSNGYSSDHSSNDDLDINSLFGKNNTPKVTQSPIKKNNKTSPVNKVVRSVTDDSIGKSISCKDLNQLIKLVEHAVNDTKYRKEGNDAIGIIKNSLNKNDFDKNTMKTLLEFAQKCPLEQQSSTSSQMDTFTFGKTKVKKATYQLKDDTYESIPIELRKCFKKDGNITSTSDILITSSLRLFLIMNKANLKFDFVKKEDELTLEHVIEFKKRICFPGAFMKDNDTSNVAAPNVDTSIATSSKAAESNVATLNLVTSAFATTITSVTKDSAEISTSPITKRVNHLNVFSLQPMERINNDVPLSSILSNEEVSLLQELKITTITQLFNVEATNLVTDVYNKWKNENDESWDFCYGVVYSWFLRAKEASVHSNGLGNSVNHVKSSTRPKRKLSEKKLTMQQPPPMPPFPPISSFLSSPESSFLQSLQVHDVFQLLSTELDDLVTALEEHWADASVAPGREFCMGIVNSWLLRARQSKDKYEHTKSSEGINGRSLLASCIDEYMLKFLDEVDIFTANDFLMADVHLLARVYRKWIDFREMSHILPRNKDKLESTLILKMEEWKDDVKHFCTFYTDLSLHDDSDKGGSDGTFVSDVEESAYFSSSSLKACAAKRKPLGKAFSLKLYKPIPSNLPIMRCVDRSCTTTVDKQTKLPHRRMTVITPCKEYLFDFDIRIKTSNIPNSGYGAFLTYKGARKATSRQTPTYYPEVFPEELHATLPQGGGTLVTIKGRNLGDEFFSLSEEKISSTDFETCNVNFSSHYQGCGLIDIGRYAPFLWTDRKPQFVFALKDFLFSHEPSGWVFDVPENFKEHEQVVDLTDDATGEPHEVAKSNIAMYVNEVGHNAKLVENVQIKHVDDRIVKYYYVQKKAMKVGETVELLVDYKKSYEEMRERKGYGIRNLNNEVKSDDDDAALFLRNLKERQEMERCVKSWSENDLLIIFKFLKERVMTPLYKNLQCEGDSRPKASWRQWVARRRLHWLKDIISEQLQKVTSRSGSHRFGNEGGSSTSDSNSDDQSSYDKNINAKFPVGSFVYVNGWRDYVGVGQVKKVQKNHKSIIMYDIMREKQMIFYNVPEGALTAPTEEEMQLAPERWRREQGFQKMAENRREMREIIGEMEWDESLNKYIHVKRDHTKNDDFHNELFVKMHRELSEEMIISASSNKYILNPYNDAFWCKTSSGVFRYVLLHMSSFQLSPCPKPELLNNIYNTCTMAAKEINDTNCVDNLSFQQNPLSMKCYQRLDERSKERSNGLSCIIPFFDSTPATSQQFTQLKAAEAELQAYYDVLELSGMADGSCFVCLSDLIVVNNKQEVSIVMTKAPWKSSSEPERLSDVIPRNINAVKSGCVEVHRYWYLWHQILSVVHPLASQIEWENDDDDDSADNVIDVDDLYSLEKLIDVLGMDKNDIELMDFDNGAKGKRNSITCL